MERALAPSPVHDDSLSPSVWRLLGEAAAMRRRILWNGLKNAGPAAPDPGRPVVVFPAFLAHEIVCTRLLRTLRLAGYDACSWGMGVNKGLREGMLEEMIDLVSRAYDHSDRKVALVGWSLGGIYAREIAKAIPEKVERVVTMASPFSGDARANNVWRIYERVAGHPVDAPPIDARPHEKPPVLTYALWSPFDGAVAPASSRGKEGERDIEVRVPCKHSDFVSHPVALKALLTSLASKP